MAENKKVQIKNTGGDRLFPRATLDNIGLNAASNTTMIASGGKILNNYLPSATSATAGTVQLATDAETSSGSETTKAVTPAGMKNAMTWTEIQDKGASDIEVQPGGVYRGTCLTGSSVISANVTSESMYGADAHVEMYLDEGAVVKTTGDLLLMDPLSDGAGNNCVVKFRDGKAYMYQEDTDAGYVVTTSASGSATAGSLAYGIVNGKRWIVLPTLTSESIGVGSTNSPANVPNHINIIGKQTGDADYKPYVALNCNLESGGITLRDLKLGKCTFSLAGSASTPKTVEFAGDCIVSSFTFTHGGIARVLPGGSLSGLTVQTELNFSNTYGNSNSFCCSNGNLKDIRFTNLDSVSGKTYDNGPVVRAFNGGTATVQNVKLVNCNAQLAAAYSSGTMKVNDCTVTSSTLLGSGGIVTCGGQSGVAGFATVEMSNCVISGTTATSGYVLKAVVEQGQFGTAFGDGLKMLDCSITSNCMPNASNYVVYASSYALLGTRKPFITMSGCSITGNTAYCGGAMTLLNDSGGIIRETVMIDNVASSGGAIFASGGYSYETNFSSCTISGNTASVGDLAYLKDAKVGFTDCRLGGTVFLDGPNGPGITLAGSNILDIECKYSSSTTKYGAFRISAGAIIDLTQCANHTSNVLYSQWPDGIKVGRTNPLIASHWILDGTATVLPYGGGAAVTITGAFQKLNRDGTTA